MSGIRIRNNRWTVGALACALAFAGNAVAQPPQGPGYPNGRLTTVMPLGGKAGTTVEVTITGTDLDDVATLHFSHPGIKAERFPDPAKQGQFIANKFNVNIAAGVPLGNHDVRAVNRWGISNPRTFVVGDLNEVLEKEPNNDVAQAHKIDLNTTANGIINPNVDVDYYSFAGKKGQRVLVVCESANVDSRLDPFVQLFNSAGRQLVSDRRYANRGAVLDAVIPADGDYYVRLCEHTHLSGGVEHTYRLNVSLAPWIDGVFPPVVEPGKPTQVTLLGRNLPNGQPDPEMTSEGKTYDKLAVQVTPPVAPEARFQLNFSGLIEPGSAGLDGFDYRVKNASGTSNPVLIGYARGPVTLDSGDNDTFERAQNITAPGDICGRIEKRRDRDWFVFTAKKDEAYALEVYADRLGSPMDTYFELYRIDDKGVRTLIQEYDDPPPAELLSPTKFFTQTDDPRARFVAPADGKYALMLTSRTADIQAGPRCIYHLSIRKEQPDFRLIVVDAHDNSPDSLSVGQGGSRWFHVFLFRTDGFAGEVTIAADGLPAGVTCPPQVLAANQKSTMLVLSATADAAAWQGEIKIKGTANVKDAAGKDVTLIREGRGGCIVLPTQPQQNIPAVGRMTRSICLAVRDKAAFTLETETKEINVPVGGQIVAKVKVNRQWADMKQPVVVAAIAGPIPPNPNPNQQPPVLATIAPDKTEAEIKMPPLQNVPPGTYNLVFRGLGQNVPFAKDAMAKKANINILEASTPIKVTVYNTVAAVTVAEPSVTIKAGGEIQITVKVARQYNYQGEFKVTLVLPQGFAGVAAGEVVIPAGANEAKLTLKSPANAAAAMNPNVIVRAVAAVDKINLTQEAKFAVNITK